MTIKIANCELLRSSLERMMEVDNFWEKLAWGAKYGDSWERPFQFDWGYFIEQEIRRRNIQSQSGCERLGRIDIAISDLTSNTLKAALELKVFGNWHVDNRLVAGFKEDVIRVNRYPVPSAAILACIFVDSKKADPEYGWMHDSGQHRVETAAGLLEKLGTTGLVEVGRYASTVRNSSVTLRLCVAAHFNEAAQGETQSSP